MTVTAESYVPRGLRVRVWCRDATVQPNVSAPCIADTNCDPDCDSVTFKLTFHYSVFLLNYVANMENRDCCWKRNGYCGSLFGNLCTDTKTSQAETW